MFIRSSVFGGFVSARAGKRFQKARKSEAAGIEMPVAASDRVLASQRVRLIHGNAEAALDLREV
jgi:hypothetical protein